MILRKLKSFALGVSALVIGACNTNAEDVCESVGNCSQGGSSDWIASCKDEAKVLQDEANANGCAAQVEDYFACANSSFDCRGATAVFPTCDAKRSALNTCLTQTKTACTELRARTSLCVGAADAAAFPEGEAGVLAACTAQRDCQARCFLDKIADTCAPRIDELEAFTSCAATCPVP